MALKLHNTLSGKVEIFKPLEKGMASIYSCGPTVYDSVHIGNLSAFIVADMLGRVLRANGYSTKHVMNYTDIDDKTIRRSREKYPDLDPMISLKKLTTYYGKLFVEDMEKVGNDTGALKFILATDDGIIAGMMKIIEELYRAGFAYIADDGIYFSIDAYRKSGKTYGQLVELSIGNIGRQRIENDEYDKDSAHDFALWKKRKDGEPAWDFRLDGVDMSGRPGWHIECSVMSRTGLGQPFDIHTGGVDLIFPHHENEIAQSTAGMNNPLYARMFVHNEHILVDGKKMAKSANNFYTLNDIIKKGVSPLAFRVLVLQSHYRKQTHFSLDNAQAAHNRLKRWRNVATLRHQIGNNERNITEPTVLSTVSQKLIELLNNDMDTPGALKYIDSIFGEIENKSHKIINYSELVLFLEAIDSILGLQLISATPDITDEQKKLIFQRERAREDKNWLVSDQLRDKLLDKGIMVRDTIDGTVWEFSSASN
jgi:cysteinyl-tRNA synthetase